MSPPDCSLVSCPTDFVQLPPFSVQRLLQLSHLLEAHLEDFLVNKIRILVSKNINYNNFIKINKLI